MPRLTPLLVLLPLLAGCTEPALDAEAAPDDEREPNAPHAEIGATTGGIEGTVVSDALVPLTGAAVTLVGSGLVVSADESGRFAFGHLAPARYQVLAEHPGYEGAQTDVEVIAEEIAPARLILRAIPGEQPYHTLIVKRGYWECMVNVVIGSPPCNLSDDPRRAYAFDVGPRWAGLVFEVRWQYSNPGQATTPGASFSSLGRIDNKTKSVCFGEFYGANPLRYRYTPGQWMAHNCNTVARNATANLPSDGFQHYGWVFPWGMLNAETQPVYSAYAAGRSRGVGFSLNQPFDVYYTAFYVEPAPRDYTGVPDT